MNTFARNALWGTLIAGGITLLGTAAANAAETSGADGVGSGSQAPISVSVPITLGGNAVSVLGTSHSAGAPAASTPAAAPAASTGGDTTSGSGGAASGTQAPISVSIPVNLHGTAVSVVGDSASTGGGSTSGTAPAAPAPAAASTTDGADGVASGTQAPIAVNVPVNVAGNGISVLGDSSSSGPGSTPAAAPAATAPVSTSGTDSILGGTQLPIALNVPVGLGGNAISVLGDSTSGGTTAGTGTPGTTGGNTTSGTDGTASGTQAPIDAAVPVNVGGNAVSVLGDYTSGGTTGGTGTTGTPGTTGGNTTSGTDGTASGTQAPIDAAVPVNVGGNAI
ncbi:MAG: DUF320 domain-containing protein, partial [Microbacterium sp.]|nr:DUF320 domain-containing protein [Microbacterium sp.]